MPYMDVWRGKREAFLTKVLNILLYQTALLAKNMPLAIKAIILNLSRGIIPGSSLLCRDSLQSYEVIDSQVQVHCRVM